MGQNQVSGGVSVLCWLAAAVAMFYGNLINSYYPTSALGDNLSTSSGTWVVVKSKIEVPRDVRNSKGP